MTTTNFAAVNGRIAAASFGVSHVIGMIGNEKDVPQLVKNELTEIVVRLDLIQEMLTCVATEDEGQLDIIIDEYKSQGLKKTIDLHIETQDKPLPWLPYKKIDLLKQQFPKDETFLVLDVRGLPWTALYLDGQWVDDNTEIPIKGVTYYMHIDRPIKEERT